MPDPKTASETATPANQTPPQTPSAKKLPPLKVQHDLSTPVVQGIARSLYEAYIENSGGLSHDGKKCPEWTELGDRVRSHWCAATLASLRQASKLSACDLELESR